ncbi:hypothetical protein EJ05DRAFT_500765 [Pseudovirgaria hyperparasitica]|uniref:Polynucleotide 5'-hydroxyl-kinase GRC3 n=1 Tax=Pseudovirgaria hyperparasitica TaxID=470096 RepID=A0A6A6W5P0_9PEZI|nr:uncharacterized protein EJ05DRAFT_500765 [Pseudovirgaria hyperparasitica]KAF2758248.1 hypothetical protein EJ05DRAFT_500765 [Pseudovirgaria hyperparasitica]
MSKRKLGEYTTISNGHVKSERTLTAFEVARARLQAAESADAKAVLTEPTFDDGDSPYESNDEDGATIISSDAIPVDDSGVSREDQKVMSTWLASDQSILNSDAFSVTLRMKYHDRLANLGTYSLRVLRGTVSMLGADFTNKSPAQRVLASATQALPLIVCTSTTGADILLFNLRRPMQALCRISPLYRSLWNTEAIQSPEDASSRRSFDRIDRSDQDPLGRPLTALHVPESVKDVLVAGINAKDPPVILVAGPRQCGKSTFIKLLLNNILSRNQSHSAQNPGSKRTTVLVLDLKYQCPAYTPPGQISLVEIYKDSYEAAHCQSYRPDNSYRRTLRAHAMSKELWEDDPTYSTKCVADLLSYCGMSLYAKPPLIINTNAYRSTSDLYSLVSLSKEACVTRFILMGLDPYHEGLLRDALPITMQGKYDVIRLPSLGIINRVRSEQQLQAIQIMSYFHERALYSSIDTSEWDPTPLDNLPRFVVSYGGCSRGFAGIILSPSIVTSLRHVVLEGSIVTLIATEDPAFTAQYQNSLEPGVHSLPYIAKNDMDFVMPDPTCSCVVGMAIVARIDFNSKTIELIIPRLCEESLSKYKPENIVLLHGCFPNPDWAYKERLSADRHDVAAKSSVLDNADNRWATSQWSRRKSVLGEYQDRTP